MKTGKKGEYILRITEAIKKEVLRLWLSGYTYREITEKTGASAGTIGDVLKDARSIIPSLDTLRENNILVKRLSEEKGEDFVEAAKRLIALEEQTGKTSEALLTEFEGLSSRILERKKKIEQLNQEAKTLNEEIQLIKDTFSKQGLEFSEGLNLLKDIRDLKAELADVKIEIGEEKAGLAILQRGVKSKMEIAEKELVRVKKVSSRFKTSNDQFRTENKNLIMMNKDLEKRFSYNYELVQKGWQAIDDLEGNKEKLTTEHKQLQEKHKDQIKLLEQRCRELQQAVEGGEHILRDLETAKKQKDSLEKEYEGRKEALEKECEGRKVSIEKEYEYAEKRAKKIIKDAVVKNKDLKAKNEVLKAENELLKDFGRPLLNELRAERKKREAMGEKQEMEAASGTSILDRLPSENPLVDSS